MTQIESDQPINQKDFHDAVWASILKLFGEYGAGRAELALIEYDAEKMRAILRCSHNALDLVKASIVALTEIGDARAAVHILLVSGTLKALRAKMKR